MFDGARSLILHIGPPSTHDGLAARLGAVRMFMACISLLPVGFALWLLTGSSYAGLALFAVVLGVSHGGYVALSPEVAAQLFGVANLGAVLGALWTAPGVAGLLSPVLAGILIDTAGYTVTITVALCASILAVLAQRTLWSTSQRRSAVAGGRDEPADLAPAGRPS